LTPDNLRQAVETFTLETLAEREQLSAEGAELREVIARLHGCCAQLRAEHARMLPTLNRAIGLGAALSDAECEPMLAHLAEARAVAEDQDRQIARCNAWHEREAAFNARTAERAQALEDACNAIGLDVVAIYAETRARMAGGRAC
jgi:hypothetical protein